jgi:hypothetical protein
MARSSRPACPEAVRVMTAPASGVPYAHGAIRLTRAVRMIAVHLFGPSLLYPPTRRTFLSSLPPLASYQVPPSAYLWQSCFLVCFHVLEPRRGGQRYGAWFRAELCCC